MKNTTITYRTAMVSDFKEGTTLITSEDYGFTIKRKYSDGVWEARGTEGQGEKCVFDSEARFYKVAE
jgi:nitrogen fixation protein FixH